LIAAALLSCISCRHAPPQNHPSTRLSSEEIEALRGGQRPVIKENSPVLVATGTLPLLHLFDAAGSVRVLDATSRIALAEVAVVPGTIVSVSADAGVIFGREKVLA